MSDVCPNNVECGESIADLASSIDGSVDAESTTQQHVENQPENTFAEETIALIQRLKNEVPVDCDAVIILKSHESELPVVFTQGHPFDVTALAAQFTRQMKNNLIADLET